MRTVLVLTAALLLARPSAGIEVGPPLSDYLISSWADSDGAPIGTVYAISQDRAGYLWLGTDGGLLRFDGFRFRNADTILRGAFPRAAAVTLCLAADGSLWVGFGNGQISLISNGQVQRIGTTGLSRGRVDMLVQDRAGTVWAVAQGRVHRYRNNEWEAIPVGKPEVRVLNAYIGHDATIYVGTARGLYRRTGEGDFRQLSESAVWALTESPKGDLWITHPTFGFMRPGDATPNAARLGNGYRLIHDRLGHLWVATIGGGVWLVQLGNGRVPEALTVAPVPAVPGDSAQALFEDRDGNVWIGTPTGLHRLTRKTLTPVANTGPVLSIEAAANGSGIWAGTMLNGLLRFSHNGRQWLRTVHSSRDVVVNSLHHDRRGTLWIGTNKGLGRLKDGRVALIPRTALAPSINWLASDSNNTLWLGNRRQLFQFVDGGLSEVRLASATSPIAFAAGDRRGRLWLAFEDGTIGLINTGAQFHHWPGPDGVAKAERKVYAIFEDSRGIVWIGANDGLHRYDEGRFSTVTFASAWQGNGIWAVVEDDDRFLWLNTDLGLLRIHPDEVAKATADATHRMRYHFFDASDGLAGASVEYLRAARTGDSTLWFARGAALTMVAPRTVMRDSKSTVNGVVRIEEASTERGPFDISTGGALAVGTRRLDVTFSVLHLSPTPRLRFRHRLEGFEDDWRDTGTRGVASYSNLSPGTYRFVVEAYSTEGVFARAATWNVRVPPTIYQTRGFQIAMVLGVALIVAGAWWHRASIVHRQFAAVLGERARVSREIHDTLLQGVVGIALQLDHLQHSQLTNPTDNARRFERLKLHLEAYIRDARQSIRDLRSPILEQRTFEQALNEMGSRLRSGTSIDFSVRVQGKARGLPARMENELLRIGHEAIVNAVRHANASRIQVELRFDDATVALRVSDDGCGFDLPPLSRESATHFGLISMNERARALGGALRVVTSVHHGTEVEAVLPVRATA